MTGTRKAARDALLAMALVVGAAQAAVGSPNTAVGATVGAAAGGCPPHGRAVCLDRADSGHTVHVRVGQTVMVALNGSTLKWSGLRQVGPTVLRFKNAVSHAGGLTASYAAAKSGRTELRASGAPKCSPGKACPQFIVVWQVRVVVG
jgi:hypothetical protein